MSSSSITSITNLLSFLDDLGVRAKKSLSQNFLIDQNITRKIAESASLRRDDLLIEIGPGPGGLTEELLKHCDKIICIELDRTFAKALSRFGDKVEVFEADILEFDLLTLLKERLKKGCRAKIVSNLPYHITTPILAKLLPYGAFIETVTVMVQKEVAVRFVAKPNTKDYSSISLFLSYYSTAKYLFQVTRNCFHPKPNVDSAIVQFHLPEKGHDLNEETFFKMTRRAFGQKRKMLRGSLKELYPTIEEHLLKIGKSITSRPQEFALADMIALHNSIQQDSCAQTHQ